MYIYIYIYLYIYMQKHVYVYMWLESTCRIKRPKQWHCLGSVPMESQYTYA